MKTLLLFLALAITAHGQILAPIFQKAPAAGASAFSRSFNGTSDYLITNTAIVSNTSTFTVMFKVKVGSTVQTSKVAVNQADGGGNRWSVYYNADGILDMEFICEGGCSGADPRTGSQIHIADTTTWHTVAYRYDGTHWDKFLDGTKTSINASITFAIATLTSSPSFNVGGFGSAGILFFNGQIAWVATANAAISDADIASFSSGCTNPTTLASWASGTGAWRLTGLASPEVDSSVGGHNLTVNGTTQGTTPTGC